VVSKYLTSQVITMVFQTDAILFKSV